jgi:predicted metal-dependent phosphoesterase TrpH
VKYKKVLAKGAGDLELLTQGLPMLQVWHVTTGREKVERDSSVILPDPCSSALRGVWKSELLCVLGLDVINLACPATLLNLIEIKGRQCFNQH